MLEFKTINIIKPNEEILNNLQNYKYKIVKEKIIVIKLIN